MAVVLRQSQASELTGMPREDTRENHQESDEDAGNEGKYQFLLGWSKVSDQRVFASNAGKYREEEVKTLGRVIIMISHLFIFALSRGKTAFVF